MERRNLTLRMGLGLFFLFSALTIPGIAGGCEDEVCLRERVENNPVLKKSFWISYQQKPVTKRVFAAPPEMVEYLGDVNKLDGYAAGVAVIQSDHPYISRVKKILESIPEPVLTRIDPKLVAVVLVQKFGSSGYADVVREIEGKSRSGFIVLDVDALNRKANQWATWKDLTAFETDSSHSIRTTIANADENTIDTALAFILLHEMGHIISVGEDFHPPWADSPASVNLENYPFTSIGWTKSEDGQSYRIKHESPFRFHERMQYYKPISVPVEEIKDAFVQVKEAGFNSLYSATNIWDDFAESFTIFVWKYLLDRPYRQEYMLEGVRQALIEPCFTTICAKKLDILQSYLDLKE